MLLIYQEGVLFECKACEVAPPSLLLVIDQIQHQRGIVEDGIMM
jgi:hypothetical protein